MTKPLPRKIIIEEYLVKTGTDGVTDLVVYYDHRGVCHEWPIERKIIRSAMAKLDGIPRAVRRGLGLINAQPVQLVISAEVTDDGLVNPELLVRVRFRDFTVNVLPHVKSLDCQWFRKCVPLAELSTPFTFKLEESQSYVLDFGRGILPIFVFGFTVSPSGENVALFTDRVLIEEAAKGGAGRIRVPCYQAPRDILRFGRSEPEGPDQSSEIQVARKNRVQLSATPIPLIPDRLLLGVPVVEIRSGLTLTQASQELRAELSRLTPPGRPAFAEVLSAEQLSIASDVMLYMEPV